MEEYRDLDLTVAVFKRVLSEDRYSGLGAGIVLQAYIPDSYPALVDLAAWARDRHRRHGGAVKVRIVKGANLAMERVEAELSGWTQAAFATKAEVDANYKRMLDVVVDPANVGSLRVGVGTNNLFEAAWALTVSAERGLSGMVEMEMLEGMAPSMAASVGDEAGGLLLYAPIARRADSESVIAYLVRRFDENTGPENFLRHQFSLQPGTETWDRERDRFRTTVGDRAALFAATRRTQDRTRPEQARGSAPECPDPPFANEPDTDVAVGVNRTWVAAQLGPLVAHGIDVVPAVVAGRTESDGTWADGRDPGDPDKVAYRWLQAGESLVDEAVVAAAAAGEQWRARSLDDRRRSIRDLEALEGDGARFTPHGTVVVVPPWNFPLAIPAGGVTAGIPQDLLQFLPTADGPAGRRLITHPGVDAVILTGAWDTARMFLGWRPDLALHAETSGKNAIVVTAAADLDGAVADIVRSLRPCRPEVLGCQPGHPGGVGLRRRPVPPAAGRRRPQPPPRARMGPPLGHGAPDPAADRAPG